MNLLGRLKNDWFDRANNLGLSYSTIVIFILLSLAATMTEIFGIGIFLPVFQFIRLGGDLDLLISDSVLWQTIYDVFNYFSIKPSLGGLLLISFFFFSSRQLFTYIRLIYNSTITQKLVQKQRNYIFSRYIEADTSYHDSVPVGNLVNIITTEVSAAVTGIMAPMGLVVYIIMLAGYLGVLFLLSWKMTLVSTIILLLVARIPSAWIKMSAKTGRSLVSSNILMSEFLVGRLQSPRLVRLAGTEIAEKNEFQQLTQTQRKHLVYSSVLQSKTEVTMEPFVIGLSLLFLYFSYSVLLFEIEVIGLYLVIAMRLMPLSKSIILQWQSVQRLMGSIEIIESKLEKMKKMIEKDNGTELLSQLKQSVLFDKVSYRYPGSEKLALKGVSIEFKTNKMTAIVGPSGSGKSTLIDLIPRLRLPVGGVVKIDGESISKYKLKSLRQFISYAPQSPQIFNGTVKSHILYGKNDATYEEIQDAVCLSGAKEFIDQLPSGLDTVVGENALKLSGGQRQRLDLARALVRKAKILILDEPTSNLDAESEEAFRRVLLKIRQETKTTIIIVAHHLASIADADQIVVLNKGVVESIGIHANLLYEKGWYSKAWKTQGLTNSN